MPGTARGRLGQLGITPLHQGELDGLCGVYAIINALRVLYPEMDRRTSELLFEAQLHSLSKERNNPLAAVTKGIGPTTLRGLISVACDELSWCNGVTVLCKKVRVRRPASLDLIWSAIGRRTDSGSAVIVGLSGRSDHWTVAHRVTARRLRLSDSSMMKILNKAACTTSQNASGYRLQADELFEVFRS